MPDIETLGILTINCNTIDKQASDEQIAKSRKKVVLYEEKEGTQKHCYTNKDINPTDNANPMVTDNNNGKIN